MPHGQFRDPLGSGLQLLGTNQCLYLMQKPAAARRWYWQTLYIPGQHHDVKAPQFSMIRKKLESFWGYIYLDLVSPINSHEPHPAKVCTPYRAGDGMWRDVVSGTTPVLFDGCIWEDGVAVWSHQSGMAYILCIKGRVGSMEIYSKTGSCILYAANTK